MKTLSNPNRMNFRYTRKFCSDINLLTNNIISGLPGNYKEQFRTSVEHLSPLGESLDTKEKSVLHNCKEQLILSGETDLVRELSRLL